MSTEVNIIPEIVQVVVSGTGPQGASGSFDGFSVDGGSAVTIFLANQTINCGNAA